MDWETDRHTQSKIKRQRERERERHTHTETDRQTDKWSDGFALNKWMLRLFTRAQCSERIVAQRFFADVSVCLSRIGSPHTADSRYSVPHLGEDVDRDGKCTLGVLCSTSSTLYWAHIRSSRNVTEDLNPRPKTLNPKVETLGSPISMRRTKAASTSTSRISRHLEKFGFCKP